MVKKVYNTIIKMRPQTAQYIILNDRMEDEDRDNSNGPTEFLYNT